jgi:formate--tetrahydrofolate ligase
VTAEQITAAGPMAALLLDAARPNLVKTMEGSPALVHGGPFGNVAQGTSTLIQTQLARKIADIVVTEGGFAFDLGGFKFIDLQCRAGGFLPAAIVLVATVRALRYQGGCVEFAKPDAEAVKRGLANLTAHLDSMKRLGLPAPIVAINRFPNDTLEELELVKRVAEEGGATAVEASHFADGGVGAEKLADAVLLNLERNPQDSPNYRPAYDVNAPLPQKIEALAKTLLGASGIELSPKALADLAMLEKAGLDKLPLCLAKTHLSISDDATVRGKPAPFVLRVTGMRTAAGAGFVVVLCGPILTMPGLAAKPAANNIDIERDATGRWRAKGLA